MNPAGEAVPRRSQQLASHHLYLLSLALARRVVAGKVYLAGREAAGSTAPLRKYEHPTTAWPSAGAVSSADSPSHERHPGAWGICSA